MKSNLNMFIVVFLCLSFHAYSKELVNRENKCLAQSDYTNHKFGKTLNGIGDNGKINNDNCCRNQEIHKSHKGVKFSLDNFSLGFYNNEGVFIVEPGDFKVFVGGISKTKLEGYFALY